VNRKTSTHICAPAQEHLKRFGRDPFLMHSMVGGDPPDGYPSGGIWVHDGREYDMETNVFDDADIGTEYRDHLDPFHDIQQQLFDTFDLGDRLRENTPHIFEDDRDAEDIHDENTDDLADLDALYREGTESVYSGSSKSIISATIVITNMAVIHGMSNAYIDELLKYLTTVLLPGVISFLRVTMMRRN
jgi:hypothetical protein